MRFSSRMQACFYLVCIPRFFASSLAAVIGVGCRQPDADAALVDLEAQTVLPIISLLAQFRVFGCVLP